jgi:hypothetical protein
VKGTYVKKIWTRYLADDYPEHVCKGSLVFKRPLQWFIRGFYFDSSAYSSDTCSLRAFAMMVLPPFHSVAFQFGDTIAYFNMNSANEALVMPIVMDAIRSKGVSIVSQFDDINGLLAMSGEIKQAGGINDKECLAYAYILIGQYEEVKPLVAAIVPRCLDHMAKFPAGTWTKEMKDRVELISALVDQDPVLAVHQLKEWRMVTLRNLKLDKYAVEV